MEGKVSFITGAARGQGRAHAVLQAAEGADIIAVDICEDIVSNFYPLANLDDLMETKHLVEAQGRRCVAIKADVRHREQLAAAVEEGVAELGKLTTLCANAGIMPMAVGREPHPLDFVDATDVDLLGVMNAVAVCIPQLIEAGREGAVVITGSTAGLMPNTVDDHSKGPNPGGAGYAYSKQMIVRYTEEMAMHLSPYGVRVNAIHPTNVNTHLLQNEYIYSLFRPDLEAGKITKEDFAPASQYFQALPIPWLEPEDVADLVLFLASDDSKNITGDNIRIDAGSMIKWPNGPS
jgi:SDR family mycofactocin-dependent oxidoreductase